MVRIAELEPGFPLHSCCSYMIIRCTKTPPVTIFCRNRRSCPRATKCRKVLQKLCGICARRKGGEGSVRARSDVTTMDSVEKTNSANGPIRSLFDSLGASEQRPRILQRRQSDKTPTPIPRPLSLKTMIQRGYRFRVKRKKFSFEVQAARSIFPCKPSTSLRVSK